MIEIELIIKGTKGNIVIKGSSFAEVLDEYEVNRDKIETILGEISVARPALKEKPSIAARSLQGRILSLKKEGFFNTPQNAHQVRRALKDKGHSYSHDHVSVGLLRLVRKKQLRRLLEEKEGKDVYVYVIP